MKCFLNLFFLCIIFFSFVGCASSGLKVGSDKRLGADISEYKTFDWISGVAQIPSDQVFVGPDGVLVFNNESTRNKIRTALQTELRAKGFVRDTEDPDMLVSFTVLEQDQELRTFTRDGFTYLGAGPVGTDTKMVEVEEGTILLNFIDAASGLQVWQGFASGAFEESDVDDPANLKSKVDAIVDQFNFSAFALN